MGGRRGTRAFTFALRIFALTSIHFTRAHVHVRVCARLHDLQNTSLLCRTPASKPLLQNTRLFCKLRHALSSARGQAQLEKTGFLRSAGPAVRHYARGWLKPLRLPCAHAHIRTHTHTSAHTVCTNTHTHTHTHRQAQT